MNPIDKVIFLLIKAGKPELCLSIMHLCPDIRRRGGFFQRRAEGKEQVYGGQDLVLGALAMRGTEGILHGHSDCLLVWLIKVMHGPIYLIE